MGPLRTTVQLPDSVCNDPLLTWAYTVGAIDVRPDGHWELSEMTQRHLEEWYDDAVKDCLSVTGTASKRS
jgi:hypothetical protein